MQAVIDFLLEYYVWILVVLVILLITVIGFLADTKKKKKMREKTITEGNNQQNVGMMDVNSVNGMNNMPNMNMNTGFNLNPVGDMNNNMFNQNMGNNMGNEVNNFNSMPNNNNSFFNSVPEQTPSFEPKPVEPVNIMNNNMNSVPTPVVEPTPVSVNPVPEVTNVNGMQNNYGVVDNQVIGNTYQWTITDFENARLVLTYKETEKNKEQRDKLIYATSIASRRSRTLMTLLKENNVFND